MAEGPMYDAGRRAGEHKTRIAERILKGDGMEYTRDQLEAMDSRTLAATALEVAGGKSRDVANALCGEPWRAMGEVVEGLSAHGLFTDATFTTDDAKVYVCDGEAENDVKAEGPNLPHALFVAAILATQSEHTP